MLLVQKAEVPHLLRRLQSIGAIVRMIGKDSIANLCQYEVIDENNNVIWIKETAENISYLSKGELPTLEKVRLNLMAVRYARNIMKQREAQLRQIIEDTKQPRMRHIIVGGGLCGTITYNTLPPSKALGVAPGVDLKEIPEVINISIEPDPWSSRARVLTDPIGQPVGEWYSLGLTQQAVEFTLDYEGFGHAQDIACAIAMTAFEAGMTIYYGRVIELDFCPQNNWPQQAKHCVRIINEANPDSKYIYADTCDLAVGLGPPRRLKEEQLAKEHEKLLRDNGFLLYGEDHLNNPRISGNGEDESPISILIIGGGATAAWNAEYVAKEAKVNRIIWLGRLKEPDDYHPSVREEINTLRGDLESTTITVEERWKKKRRLRDLLAFCDTMNMRNISIFDNPRIERRIGEVHKIVPYNEDKSGKIRVIFKASSGDGIFDNECPIEDIFDRIIISIGQEAGKVYDDGPISAFMLLKNTKIANRRDNVELKMIIKDGRLVGLESIEPQGVLRILGAAMNQTLLTFISGESARNKYRQLLSKQTHDESVPEHSRGVVGSIYQVCQNVPRANTV